MYQNQTCTQAAMKLEQRVVEQKVLKLSQLQDKYSGHKNLVESEQQPPRSKEKNKIL